MNKEIIVKTYQDMQQECAPIYYKEIERFFAKGAMILIDDSLDIIKVALIFQDNATDKLQQLMAEGKVIRVYDDYAKKWSQGDTQLLAIAVVPWLLVQEIDANQ